jgi:hypothetical protein
MEKYCLQLSTDTKRHVAFRKADESLVCSDKTWQFLQSCVITFKNKYNFWVFYRWIYLLSLYSFSITALEQYFLLYILISTTYFIQFPFICVLSFLHCRATFCFTNPDYRLIWITSPQLLWISEGLLYYVAFYNAYFISLSFYIISKDTILIRKSG